MQLRCDARGVSVWHESVCIQLRCAALPIACLACVCTCTIASLDLLVRSLFVHVCLRDVSETSAKTYPPINKLTFRPVRHTSPEPVLKTMLNSEGLFFFWLGISEDVPCQHCFEGGTGESEQAEVKFVDGLTAQIFKKSNDSHCPKTEMLCIPGRRIGRCCEFLEDVSEDVHFVWKNLADVKISKGN